MSKISTWSTTAASNNTASPDGFPEGMAPSGVNNSAREVMAAVREQHESAEWIDLGNTPTQTSATTFTLVGDQTTAYHVGRRVKCTDSSTLYGVITVSAFTSLTTVTIVLDSGSLSASLTAVALGILSKDNTSFPEGMAINAATLDLSSNAVIDGDIILTEKADHSSTPSAGNGYLWVKSDAPSTLQYTDDDGTDHQLSGMFHGRVPATTGTSTVDGPTGWSYNWTGTGDCVITHNLGVSTYTVQLTCRRNGPYLVNWVGTSTTTFTIKAKDVVNNIDLASLFSFMLTID